MNKILLIIKSQTFRDAKLAANERGIHITDIVASGTTFTEFRARTDEKNLLAVQQWFSEEPPLIPRFGYPIGTLLFFRIPD